MKFGKFILSALFERPGIAKEDQVSPELGMGSSIMDQVVQAQEPLKGFHGHSLRGEALAAARQKLLVDVLNSHSSERLFDFLVYANTLEYRGPYLSGGRHYNIREKTTDLRLGLMKLGGDWQPHICHQFSEFWYKEFRGKNRMTVFHADKSYLPEWAITDTLKFLRFMKKRNASALQEGATFQIITQLEDIFSNGDTIPNPARLRVVLAELRTIMGEDQSQLPAFPTTNSKKIEFSFPTSGTTKKEIFLRFVSEVNNCAVDVRQALSRLDRVGKLVSEGFKPLGPHLGFDESLLDRYAKLRADVGEKSHFRTHTICSELLRDQLPMLSAVEAGHLFDQIDRLQFEIHDFSRDAPPLPEHLLFPETDIGPELSRLLSSATGSKPSKIWLKKAREFATVAGVEKFGSSLSAWLAATSEYTVDEEDCVDRATVWSMMRSCALLKRMLDDGITVEQAAILAFSDSALLPLRFSLSGVANLGLKPEAGDHFMLSKTNAIIGKGVVWALSELRPNDVEGLFERVAIEMSTKVPIVVNGQNSRVCRSQSLASACVWELASIDSPKAIDALESVRMRCADTRLQKLISKVSARN